jgi:hypothetical protein
LQDHLDPGADGQGNFIAAREQHFGQAKPGANQSTRADANADMADRSDKNACTSKRPTTPMRKAGAVPPAYITWSSSTAAIGSAKAKSKQKVIHFFMPNLLWFQQVHTE